MKNFLLFFLLLLTSCSSAIKSPYITKTFDFPAINEVMTMTLGETLVLVGHSKVGEGIRLNQAPEPFLDINKKTAFFFTTYRNDKCYGPFRNADAFADFAICIREKPKKGTNSYYLVCGPTYPDYVAPCVDSLGNQDLNISYELVPDMEVISDNTDSFKQEFIYNGKVNNSIKFIYREFSSNMNRFAFQQEVQYDLNESKIIGFKELKIEIIEATNQLIKYKVLKNFTPK